MIIKTPKKYPFSIFDLGVIAHILGHLNPDGRFTGSGENIALAYLDSRNKDAHRKAVNRSISKWVNLGVLEEIVPSRPKPDGNGMLPRIVRPTCTLLDLFKYPDLGTLSHGKKPRLSQGKQGVGVPRSNTTQLPDESDTKPESEPRPCPKEKEVHCPKVNPGTPSQLPITTNGDDSMFRSGLVDSGECSTCLVPRPESLQDTQPELPQPPDKPDPITELENKIAATEKRIADARAQHRSAGSEPAYLEMLHTRLKVLRRQS
jgi:hypothetical protein